MAKYRSGQKIIQERVNALQKEMNDLKSTSPSYGVERGNSYGRALAALRDAYAEGKASLQPKFAKADGSSIARPLTFEETIDAIVNAYESRNKELLTKWNDSCTGIASKGGTTRFKVVPVSQNLILLCEDFSSPFVLVDYESQPGTELDTSKGKYNVPLTKPEVLKNPGWLESVRDKSLLKAFRDIVYAERRTKTAMGYYVENEPEQDQLWALAVGVIDYDSYASGRLKLNNNARFVRVSPK